MDDKTFNKFDWKNLENGYVIIPQNPTFPEVYNYIILER